jgi:uncharacterized phiE125 gp8 family phage protein
MTLTRLQAPVTLPISIFEAKKQLRVQDDTDDILIDSYIRAALAHLDGPDGLLGKAIEKQTWKLELDQFPTDEIILPVEPVNQVISINYLDENEEEVLIDPSDYKLKDNKIYPVSSWPTSTDVTIQWEAGKGATEDIKQAVKLIISHWYANREATNNESLKEIPMGFYTLVGAKRKMAL